jgi:AcrR family transcriptional regulator
MSPSGRRPGHADTKGEIIEAAKRIFAASGYEKASLRAVAREAGVDAALVHHYFDGKAELFVAAMSLPFDPRVVKRPPGTTVEPGMIGAHVVEGFLTMWDIAEQTGSSFATCAAAMAASPNVADAMREFVAERVWSTTEMLEGEDEASKQRRNALVATQLMGLAFTRYILRVPPISTATPAQIAEWVGPIISSYMKGGD